MFSTFYLVPFCPLVTSLQREKIFFFLNVPLVHISKEEEKMCPKNTVLLCLLSPCDKVSSLLWKKNN